MSKAFAQMGVIGALVLASMWARALRWFGQDSAGRGMTQAILLGDPPIEVTLRRSAQARRISLRVSKLDGRVTLSLPRWTPEREALAFAHEKERWIRQNLAARPQVQRPVLGGHVPFEGQMLPLVAGTGRSLRIDQGSFQVPARAAARLGPAMAGFLKQAARTRLAQASEHYARALGVSFGKISLRDTRSRWGSCTSAGDLMYSWRLIMAPREVLAYVAAHEVAHLVEMNHSPAYWAVVAQVYPEYAAPRAWLRREGQALHGWQFGD